MFGITIFLILQESSVVIFNYKKCFFKIKENVVHFFKLITYYSTLLLFCFVYLLRYSVNM